MVLSSSQSRILTPTYSHIFRHLPPTKFFSCTHRIFVLYTFIFRFVRLLFVQLNMPLKRTPPPASQTSAKLPPYKPAVQTNKVVDQLHEGIHHSDSAPDLRLTTEISFERKKRKFNTTIDLRTMLVSFAQQQLERFKNLKTIIHSFVVLNHKLTVGGIGGVHVNQIR